MSLITIDQFSEIAEDYPELAQCYNFTYTQTKDAEEEEEPIGHAIRD